MLLYNFSNLRVRKEALKTEYARAGVPVYEVTYRQYLQKWKVVVQEDHANPSEFMGIYHNDRAVVADGLPARFILINKSMPNYEKLMVLWHEVGHHSCVKANCLCAKGGFEFRKTELHAELACIYVATQRRCHRMVLELIKEAVEDLMNNSGRSFDYIRNATMMVKHPAFAEAVEMVRPEFNRWLGQHRVLKERYEVALADTATRMCRWHPTNYLKRFASPIE